MATSIMDTDKVDITPDKVKIPFALKLTGKYVDFVDSWIYRKNGTVNRKLQRFFEPKVAANSRPVNGISSKDISIDSVNDVWIRVFTPTQQKEANEQKTKDDGSGTNSDKRLPVIIFCHGGGFVGLSANAAFFDGFARDIARACNAVVVSVNYRLAPEFPCPAAYDDCYKALEWLRSPDSQSDLPPTADISKCFLFGDSAGANIVHFTGCRAAESDISPVKLRGMVELQPFFGGEELTPSEINMKPPILSVVKCHWAWRAFLPGENRDHPNINVFGPNSPNISGLSLPPIFVAIGSLDLLKDRQASYVKKLQEMGKDVTVINYAGAPHAFYAFKVGKLAQKLVEDIRDFISSRTL